MKQKEERMSNDLQKVKLKILTKAKTQQKWKAQKMTLERVKKEDLKNIRSNFM